VPVVRHHRAPAMLDAAMVSGGLRQPPRRGCSPAVFDLLLWRTWANAGLSGRILQVGEHLNGGAAQ